MKFLLKKVFLSVLVALLLGFGLLSPNGIFANQLEELQKKIEEYQSQVNLLSSQAKTLSNQIAQFDAQINLTTLKISQTEEKIILLSGRIDQLEDSLDSLTEAFSSRAVETYKLSKVENGMAFILSATDLNEAVSRYHYLQRIQEADRSLLIRLQEAQTTYIGEKVDQEELQQVLGAQKVQLDSQKAAKAYLLTATKNDEKKYQQLLAQARSEYEAIQAIIAGRGKETEVGFVNQGQRIANVIPTASCNSSAAHLHFIVRKPGGITDNPFSHLQGGVSYENCSGSSCGSGDGDDFNPSGSWPWPVSPTIKLTQGYGSTWAVRNSWVGRIYSFHNGIDIVGSSSEVRAVKSGTLYQGSYNVGCLLKYVRVDHDDSDLDTLYLHVNY
jgi:peptidoglycan hydrolase CwlO-like protein